MDEQNKKMEKGRSFCLRYRIEQTRVKISPQRISEQTLPLLGLRKFSFNKVSFVLHSQLSAQYLIL